MNPEIESMLDDALASIQSEIDGVSRVEVEPDYESELSAADVPMIKTELEQLIGSAQIVPQAIASHDGQEVSSQNYPALSRFIRKISLHGGAPEKPWVQVIPPGNWI